MGGQQPARSAGRRRGQLAKRERRLTALANRQHAAISRWQLLDGGLSVRTIERRVEAGRLWLVHRGVYAWGAGDLSQHGQWMAAVLACGAGAVLSHQSAAALWGLMRPSGSPVEITAAAGRGRSGIALHEGGIAPEDRTKVGSIPVTTVARTLFDVAEEVDEKRLRRLAEEADRLRLLSIPELEAVCTRCPGRRALRPIRGLIDATSMPDYTQSPLEDQVLALCRQYDLPLPATGATVLGREVDAFWPAQKLMVEADSWEFHRHRAAFERDRARDAQMQAEGYRVVRLTHRRMKSEPTVVAEELRRLLNRDRNDRRAGS